VAHRKGSKSSVIDVCVNLVFKSKNGEESPPSPHSCANSECVQNLYDTSIPIVIGTAAHGTLETPGTCYQGALYDRCRLNSGRKGYTMGEPAEIDSLRSLSLQHFQLNPASQLLPLSPQGTLPGTRFHRFLGHKCAKCRYWIMPDCFLNARTGPLPQQPSHPLPAPERHPVEHFALGGYPAHALARLFTCST
jgi:hypothetical protein